MVREKYRGFILDAGVYTLQGNLGWSPNLVIEKHDGRGVTAIDIPTTCGVFDSIEKAVNAALADGRAIVDRLTWPQGAAGEIGPAHTHCVVCGRFDSSNCAWD